MKEPEQIKQPEQLNQPENKMGTAPIPGLVISMAIPFMLSLLIQALYNLVDSIYVARINQDALTATSLSYPFNILIVAIGLGYAVGINALISRMLGAGQYEEVGNTATTGLIMSAVSSLVFVIAGIFFIDPIVGMLTNSTLIAEMVRDYLQICMAGCTGIFLHIVILRFMQASGKIGISMLPLLFSALLNIILDPIMIFGYLGCPAMGIKGAAIATVFSQWACVVIAVWMNQKWNPEVQPRFRGYRWSWKTCLTILKIGIPTSVTHGMQSIVNFFMNALLLTVSPTAVAFFGVYFKLQSFLTMPMSGLGQAALPIVGYNLGAKKSGRIREAYRTVIVSALAVAVVSTAVLQLMPAQLLGLFSAGEELLAIGIPAIRVISWGLCFSAVTIVLGFLVSGLGNAVVNMLGNAFRQIIFLLPFAWILLRTGGIGKVWYAYWIAETVGCALTVWMSVRVTKQKLKEIE